MPELPEVETVRRSLQKLVIGKKIESIDVYYERIIQNISIEDFKNVLVGETFNQIERVGKYLVFILDHYILLSHLRMEGKYFLKGNEEKNKHDHIIFNLTDGHTFRYNDTRKFGVMYLYNTTRMEEVLKVKPLSELGLEPFSPKMNLLYLKERFKDCHRPLKTVLLDQTIISGLGNIYADEVCFMSKLNPLIIVSKLKDKDIINIIDNSQKVLNKAIALGGTTIHSFLTPNEISGRFQNELLIHTKDICPVCNANVIKIYVGGRGTYYCPNCQK